MELIVDNGKVVEPGTIDKIKAKVMMDKELRINLPAVDVTKIVGDHIFIQSKWLQEYTHYSLTFDEVSNSYQLVFTKSGSKP